MTTINLLVNHGIPTGWTDALPWLNLTNQQPHGFHTHIAVPGEELDSADSYTGPDDAPVVTNATVVPECVHIHKSHLPADEQPGAENALILEGEWVYKVFAAFGSFSHDTYAWVRAPAKGMLEVAVPVQVHYNPYPGGDGSPGAAVWRVWVNERKSRWGTFENDFVDREWSWDWFEYPVTAGQVVTIRLQLESRSEAGIDFFTDLEAWEAMFTPDDDPEEPGPPAPSECRGAPRGQYARVVNVVPADATPERFLDIAEIAWDAGRQTVTGSYDDAGIGDLDDRAAVLWDIPTDERYDYGVFFDAYYPGVTVLFKGDGAPTPDPEPDPPPIEPQYTLRSNNLIGLHSGFTKAQSFPYILNSGATIQKFFSAGDAYEAAKIAPGIVSVWRKYVGNEQGRIWQEPTIRESAAWYLQQYTAEIETARTNMGLTLAQFLARKIALESLNETIPSFNESVLRDAVEFDVHFCELAHERYGDAIDTVLLCGAIGNPHESEVPLLLPAAKIAAQWEDFIGYHCYWTANEYRSFLAQHWPYHAGRWMEWDTYFRSQGVYPRYASGEGGIVYAWDGQSFDSGKGWRACGSFERYLADIDAFNSKCLVWNEVHGNRFAGPTLFGYANWGWDNFELGDGEVILLNEWAQGL